LKVLVLHDKSVGLEILDIVRETDPDCIAKTPGELPDYYDEFGKLDAPPWLKEYSPDWVISAWWPKIIHPSILSCAKRTLNTHNSFLPWCKGKHPNFWAIVDQVPYGVSLHEISTTVDGGEIYAKQIIQSACEWENTGQSLYDFGLTTLVGLFRREWPRIRANAKASPQVGGTFHLAKELEPARTIDLDVPMSPRRLLNVIRAGQCNGHTAHFRDGMDKYSVEVKIRRISN
jgi:methionyl-tRNA formyltransferase